MDMHIRPCMVGADYRDRVNKIIMKESTIFYLQYIAVFVISK